MKIAVSVHQCFRIDRHRQAVWEEAALRTVLHVAVQSHRFQASDILVDPAADIQHARVKELVLPKVVFVRESRTRPCFLPLP